MKVYLYTHTIRFKYKAISIYTNLWFAGTSCHIAIQPSKYSYQKLIEVAGAVDGFNCTRCNGTVETYQCCGERGQLIDSDDGPEEYRGTGVEVNQFYINTNSIRSMVFSFDTEINVTSIQLQYYYGGRIYGRPSIAFNGTNDDSCIFKVWNADYYEVDQLNPSSLNGASQRTSINVSVSITGARHIVMSMRAENRPIYSVCTE